MKERIQAVQRQVRENGVSYNVYADPEGADRPWELDVLPLIIPPDEWRGLAAASFPARAGILQGADDEHVTIAWGRDFGDVTPMRGVILGGGGQSLRVHVTVTPLGEDAQGGI
jgi:hypothetical protein